MYFMGLNKSEKKKLETEVISNGARLRLTRLMRKRCESNDSNVNLINRNWYINTARSVLDLPIYRLEPDDWGMYMNEEFGLHMAETELVMRRPDTTQLIVCFGFQFSMLIDTRLEDAEDHPDNFKAPSRNRKTNLGVIFQKEGDLELLLGHSLRPWVRASSARPKAPM